MARRICFLPSGEMLRAYRVEHWLRRFGELSGRVANELVLPGVGFSGPLYSSNVHPMPKDIEKLGSLPDWVVAAREVLGSEATIWASIVVDFGFMGNEALWLLDQYGDPLRQACLVNPVTQRIISTFVAELAEQGIDGVALDVTDAYPNSTGVRRSGFLLHCFCDYCVDELGLAGFSESRKVFGREPSPARFLLRADDDGVAHIDIPDEWLREERSEMLVNLALARNFVEGEFSDLQGDASTALSYLRARVDVTARAIRDILADAPEGQRTAIVLGDHKADMSQLVTLESLARVESAQEYWLPLVPRKSGNENWRAVQVLAGRSTYYLNTFFEVVENAVMHTSIGGAEDFLQALFRASRGLKRNNLTPGAAFTAENLVDFEGFAGVPLTNEDYLEIVNITVSAAIGDSLPPSMLEQFRIQTPRDVAGPRDGGLKK